MKALILALLLCTPLLLNAQSSISDETRRMKEELERLKIDQQEALRQLEQMKRDAEYEKREAIKVARDAETERTLAAMQLAREKREAEDRKVIGNARAREEAQFIQQIEEIEKIQKTNRLSAETVEGLRSWLVWTKERRQSILESTQSLKNLPPDQAKFHAEKWKLIIADFWQLRHLNRVNRIYSTEKEKNPIQNPTQYLHSSTLHTQRSKSRDIAAECEHNLGYLQEAQKTRYLTAVEVQWLSEYIKLLQRAGRRMESYYDTGETARLYPERDQLPLMESIYNNERSRWNAAGKR